jgi:hypothetical protein
MSKNHRMGHRLLVAAPLVVGLLACSAWIVLTILTHSD